MIKMNRCYERPINYGPEASYKQTNSNMNYNEYPQAMPEGMMDMGMMGCNVPPIYECPQERVCHKEYIHEVPHVCPINTRIINHHIYRHTYTPCYTCCEENEVCNIYDGCCNKF